MRGCGLLVHRRTRASSIVASVAAIAAVAALSIMVVGLCFMATAAAAFQPHLSDQPMLRTASSHRRVLSPSAGFFDEMKEAFDFAMGNPESAPSSAPPPPTETKRKTGNKFFDALTFVDDGDTAGMSSGNAPSFLDAIKAVVSPGSLTPEERVAAGEGVVWSADYSRAWKAKNGFPSTELSIAEAKELLEELSLPVPPQAGGGNPS